MVLREEYGYELVSVRPVDMFPHNPRTFEAVAGALCAPQPAAT